MQTSRVEDVARSRIGFRGHTHFRADLQLRDVLLRHGEVHVDRIQGLERDHGIAGRQVLTQIDLTDAEHAGKGRADDRLL